MILVYAWSVASPHQKASSNNCGDVIMSAMVSQVIAVSIVCSTVCSGTDLYEGNPPVTDGFPSPHKGPVTRKMSPFDDVIKLRISVHLHMCHSSRNATYHPLFNFFILVDHLEYFPIIFSWHRSLLLDWQLERKHCKCGCSHKYSIMKETHWQFC